LGQHQTKAGNSIWKIPGGGEQADPHNNRPDPAPDTTAAGHHGDEKSYSVPEQGP